LQTGDVTTAHRRRPPKQQKKRKAEDPRHGNMVPKGRCKKEVKFPGHVGTFPEKVTKAVGGTNKIT